jgi:hypothetical protein
MTLREYRQLQAEKGELDRLLAAIPSDRVIERIGLESKRSKLEEELSSQPAPKRDPVSARLTFRGKPIVASCGIFADFGANAVNTFSDAIISIGAGQFGPLGSRGVLPGRDEFRMLITGTAVGSFGFELEEASVGELSLFPEASPLEAAIDQAKKILASSLGTDDELTDALSDTEPRALEAIRKFLDVMVKNEAVCALEFKGDIFRFADVEQVRRSAGRLGQDNIHEEEARFAGAFLGVLPHRRTFEFQPQGSQEVISGRVGKEFGDADAINRMVGESVVIVVHSRRAGQGHPRYMLLRKEPAGHAD